jgi:hypothetical protein
MLSHSSLHRSPPPYVPPEFMKCKFSEMPEPYKSEITAWINRETKRREQALAEGRLTIITACSVCIVFEIVFIIILLTT